MSRYSLARHQEMLRPCGDERESNRSTSHHSYQTLDRSTCHHVSPDWTNHAHLLANSLYKTRAYDAVEVSNTRSFLVVCLVCCSLTWQSATDPQVTTYTALSYLKQTHLTLMSPWPIISMDVSVNSLAWNSTSTLPLTAKGDNFCATIRSRYV